MDDRYGRHAYGQYLYKCMRPDPLAKKDAESIFLFPPNWRDGLHRTIEWRTVIAVTPYGVEQRRPQQILPLRRLSYTVLLAESRLSELLEWCERMRVTPLWWPLWPEGVRLAETGSLLGLTTLTPAASLATRWDMLHYTRHLILAHCTERDVAQVLEADTIAEMLVTLIDAVSIPINGENAVLYPAVSGFVEEYLIQDVTDAVATINLTLSEVRATQAIYQPS